MRRFTGGATGREYLSQRLKDGPNGCIEWSKGVDKGGYGFAWYVEDGRHVQTRSHRLAYEEYIGAIPDGLFVLHRCDNPPCCNPEHLFLGTAKDNAVDCAKKGRRRNQNGENNSICKLSNESVAAIREQYRWHTKGKTMRALAEKYGVALTTVQAVLEGRTWKDQALSWMEENK